MIEFFEFPDGYREAVYAETEFSFTFGDRLRLLLGYRMTFRSVVLVEHVPGRTAPWNEKARLRFERPRWLPAKRPKGVFAEAQMPAERPLDV